MFSFDFDEPAESAAPSPSTSTPAGDVNAEAEADAGTKANEDEEDEDELGDGEDSIILVDAWRVPRGRCTSENCSCRLWKKATGPFSHLNCGGCQCKTTDHQDLSAWMRQVLEHSTPSVESRLVSKGIPVKAYTQWSPIETMFHLETEGAFTPGRDSRVEEDGVHQAASPMDNQDQQPMPLPLCSVICPTTSDRHSFHPLLYHCFSQQTYQPKELVVIDNGPRPSPFLSERAKRDPSLVYRWFGKTGRWTIGTKRNLACFLARGELLAHFDDDDLYATDYLERMSRVILKSAASSQDSGDGTVGGARMAATLSAWHVFDTDARTFRFLHAVSDKWVYGWGFSFVFTREAWRNNYFPHRDIGEDFDFMMALRKLPGASVFAVEEEAAICSHTYHPKLSISGGEKRRGGDGNQGPIGKEVAPPDALITLLPLLFDAEWRSLREMGRRLPTEEDYSYSLLGSWNGWSGFIELKRHGSGRLFSATIGIPATLETVEFQVYANNDFTLSYYPAATGAILGPWRCPGQNWKVQVPKGKNAITVSWDPTGEKKITIQTLRTAVQQSAPTSSAAPAKTVSAKQPPKMSQASPASKKQTPRLLKTEAIQIQEALIKEYSKEDFQRKLRDIYVKTIGDQVTRMKLRQDLCLPIQGPIIAMYGFEPSRLGVAESVQVFKTADWGAHPEVSKNNDLMAKLTSIDELLA